MPKNNAHINDELLTKYLAGEASLEETRVVEVWCEVSEQNRRALHKMKMLWEQSGEIAGHERADVDIEKAWATFKNRIEKQADFSGTANNRAGKSRSLYFYVSRVAAVLVVGIFFYYLVSDWRAVEQTRLTSAENVVADTLSDGSIIHLNAYSQLVFPENFDEDKRQVTLEGEAFFEVVPNPEKPFLVEIDGAVVEVLGTSFYVKAYDTTQAIVVGVEEGKVKVSTAGSEIILQTGETVTINSTSERQAALEPDAPFDPNDLFWKSKTLVFQNEKLANVFQALEEKYQIEIESENSMIANCRLTAKFSGEDIERIIEIINTNFNLTSRNEDDHIIISGNGCD